MAKREARAIEHLMMDVLRKLAALYIKEADISSLISMTPLAGQDRRMVVNESLTESFTNDNRDRHVPVTKEIRVEGNHISYLSPPHSFTQIRVGVQKWDSSSRPLPSPRAID
jgi:hypothetical protein